MLSNNRCLAYCLPVIGTTGLFAPVNILQGIYAKHYGLQLTSIALVLLLARIFDAVSDPIVGYCSDRYYHKYRTYKPIIFIGGLLLVISSNFLYVPPVDVDIYYFTAWFIIFYFAWTLFEIPHLAWSGVLAEASQSKAKIFSFRSVGGYIGLLLFYFIPLLPIFETSTITPETLKVLVFLVSILMLPSLVICLKIKDSPLSVEPNPSGFRLKKISTKHTLQSIIKNKPLLIFLSAFFMVAMANGVWYSLIFLYIDVYLGLGEQFAKTFLIAFIIGIIVTPAWYKIAILLGKKTAWILANILAVSSFFATGCLSPNDTVFVDLVALKTVQTVGFTGFLILAPAMLSELIDFSRWKYHDEGAAIYFSIYAFITKTATALAASVGLGLAGWYGFDATGSSQSLQSIIGIKFTISQLPIVFAMLGFLFILLSPINEYRHGVIRSRLVARQKREN